MTEELKKELKEELDIRLRDLLFEKLDTARRITRTIIREVLRKHNILDAVIVTTNQADTDVVVIVSFGGRSYECKIVVGSAKFSELQPESKT